MADRLARLLKTLGAKDGKLMMTGGLAGDAGLLAALQEKLDGQKSGARIISHEHSIFAGAIGAALWARSAMPNPCYAGPCTSLFTFS